MRIPPGGALRAVLRKLRDKRRAFQARHNRAGVFAAIYRDGMWGSHESVSGTGSTLQATEFIRQRLPDLFSSLGVRSIVDVPCGDFHWMQAVVDNSKLRYHGFDIVPDLIRQNIKRYGNATTQFSVLDIVKSVPPKADLVFCRHLLIHLTFPDGIAAIRNFQRSGSRYLLITSQPDCPENVEIGSTGMYRPVNLELSPFRLSPIARIPDPQAPTDRAELVLLPLDQISL